MKLLSFKKLMILLQAGCAQVLAAQPIVLNSVMNGVDLSENAIVWLASPTLNLVDPCLSHPKCLPEEGKLVETINGSAGYPEPGETLYFRQSVYNPSNKSQTYILVADWSLTENFYLLVQSGNLTMFRHASYQKNPINRDYNSAKLSIRVAFPPGESVLIARLDNRGFDKALIKLWDTQSLDEIVRTEKIIIWTLYGFTIALILNMLTIFFTIKNPGASWAAMSLTCLVLADLCYRGYEFEIFNLLQLEYHNFRTKSIFLFGMVAVAGLCMTLSSTINLKQLNPPKDRFLRRHALMTLFFVIPGLFFNFEAAMLIFTVINFYMIPSLISLAKWAFRVRVIPRYAMFLTYVPYATASGIFIIQNYGIIKPTFIFDLGVVVGYLLLSLALSFFFGKQYNDMQREKIQALISQESVKASLEVASVVQKNLLPQRTPKGFYMYEFYRPAEIVGGDSYYLAAKKDYVFFSIFDVTGHGISSAIITGSISGAIKSILNHEIKNDIDPKTILTRITLSLNESIFDYNHESKDHLVTMSSILIDTRNSHFYYANCGHIASYLITPAKVQTLFSSGSPLGLSLNPSFTIKDYALDSQDKILFMTDGVLENKTIEGKLLKETQILRQLRTISDQNTQGLGHHLEGLLRDKFEGLTLDDDMSFVVVGKATA